MSGIDRLLEGKVVVLIGGAGLLGQAFARATLAAGAITVLADLEIERATAVRDALAAESSSDRLHSFAVDITSKASLEALISDLCARFGHVDAVVNSAYPRNKQYGRRLENVEYADFCENISLHLGGYFLSTQQFAKYFRQQGHGHVVNMSSIYGIVPPRFDIYRGTPMTMPVEYAAIKSALQHLSLYFMRYYQGTPLRFNCISPGGILDMQPQKFVDAYRTYSQSKGMLVPQDITGTLIYLLSDLSQFVNGQNIVVDDGWSA